MFKLNNVKYYTYNGKDLLVKSVGNTFSCYFFQFGQKLSVYDLLLWCLSWNITLGIGIKQSLNNLNCSFIALAFHGSYYSAWVMKYLLKFRHIISDFWVPPKPRPIAILQFSIYVIIRQGPFPQALIHGVSFEGTHVPKIYAHKCV